MNRLPAAVLMASALAFIALGALGQDNPATEQEQAISSVSVRVGDQALKVSTYEAGTSYEVDGTTLRVLTPTQPMSFTVAQGYIEIPNGGMVFQVPEVFVRDKQGKLTFAARLGESGMLPAAPPVNGEPPAAPPAGEFSEAETPKAEENKPPAVNVQAKPPERPTFRVQQSAKKQ